MCIDPDDPPAGHTITLDPGGGLAADVCRWFSADYPLP